MIIKSCFVWTPAQVSFSCDSWSFTSITVTGTHGLFYISGLSNRLHILIVSPGTNEWAIVFRICTHILISFHLYYHQGSISCEVVRRFSSGTSKWQWHESLHVPVLSVSDTFHPEFRCRCRTVTSARQTVRPFKTRHAGYNKLPYM